MNKFKVGDKVKVVNTNKLFPQNLIGTIKIINPTWFLPNSVKWPTINYSICYLDKELSYACPPDRICKKCKHRLHCITN